MASDKHVHVDEVISANKIRLVVTDAAQSNIESDATALINTAPSSNDPANAPVDSEPLPNADKLLNELPLDEFFRVLDKATPEQLQSIIHSFEKSARTTGGSKILSKVIQVPPEPRTLISLIAWWEWRRPLYNAVLMLVGLPSILILSFLLGMPLYVTVMSGLAYLFMANICYTLGTPAELVAKTIYKEKAETYGPVLLTLGTIFSVIVTVVLELVIVGLTFIGTTAPLWW